MYTQDVYHISYPYTYFILHICPHEHTFGLRLIAESFSYFHFNVKLMIYRLTIEGLKAQNSQNSKPIHLIYLRELFIVRNCPNTSPKLALILNKGCHLSCMVFLGSHVISPSVPTPVLHMQHVNLNRIYPITAILLFA